jgi:hypothetical protein
MVVLAAGSAGTPADGVAEGAAPLAEGAALVGAGAVVAVVLVLAALVAGAVVDLVAVLLLLLDPQPASASRLAAASKAVALW